MTTKEEMLENTKNKNSDGIKASSNPLTQYVDGFPLPALLPVHCYRAALKYKPRSGDIFIASYPKSGTTWTQYILLLLFRQGEPIKSMQEFMFGSPYLEMMNAELHEKLTRPVGIKTHLPYHLAPRSDDAKYICITRNPKDCCVSYFHHMSGLHGFSGTFDEFFELFISGNIDYGNYFDHVLGWYEHRNDANILFLTYEELKENPKENILKIASFIGDKLYAEPLRNDLQKLENVLKHSSFEFMKESLNQQIFDMVNMPKEDILKSDLPSEVKELFEKFSQMPGPSFKKPQSVNFVRKGIIGDWRNYFSEDQNRRLEEKFTDKMQDTDLGKFWRKYM